MLWIFFFCEILTFLDQLADRSELLGQLCVIRRETKCCHPFVLQPSHGSALSTRIFAVSHFGKETPFLSSCSCYPLLVWHRCPRSFWVYSKQHTSFRQEMWWGDLQFMADLYCWLIFLLCTLLSWELPRPGWWRQGQQWKLHKVLRALLWDPKGKPFRGWCWNPKFQ